MAPPRHWRSPVSFEASIVAAMLREALDALEYRYARKQGERAFGETIALDPHERGTPAWRFFVDHPAPFVLETYDTKPRRDGVLGHLEVHGFRDEHEPVVRRVLRRVLEEAPHPPWSFSYDLRMRIGPFSGAYREARRAWKPVVDDEPLAAVEA